MVSTDIPYLASRDEHTREVTSGKAGTQTQPGLAPHIDTTRTDRTHGLLVLELSSVPAGRVRWRVPLASGVDMVQGAR